MSMYDNDSGDDDNAKCVPVCTDPCNSTCVMDQKGNFSKCGPACDPSSCNPNCVTNSDGSFSQCGPLCTDPCKVCVPGTKGPGGTAGFPPECDNKCDSFSCNPNCVDDGNGGKTCGPLCPPADDICKVNCISFPGGGGSYCADCPAPSTTPPTLQQCNDEYSSLSQSFPTCPGSSSMLADCPTMQLIQSCLKFIAKSPIKILIGDPVCAQRAGKAESATYYRIQFDCDF